MIRITWGRWEWQSLAGLALLKFALLAAFGPTWEPDWYSYSQFADIILGDRQWLVDAGLADAAAPLTLFRSIGYPLAVAGLRALSPSPELAHGVLVVIQILLSLAATVLVWRVAALVLNSRALALLAAAGHAGGIGLLYDQSLLSDSLYASLFILGWAVPLIGLLEGRRPALPVCAALGAALAYSCLVRGTGLPFMALVAPPVALWTWRWRRPTALGLFLAPVVVTVGVAMAWNHARVGAWTMTTGAQYVMIQPLVKAAARGHDVFDGDTALDRVARAHLKTFEYGEVMDIVEALFRDEGVDALDSARLHKQLYLRAWGRHPLAMLENTINNFNVSVIVQLADPVDNALFYARMVMGERMPGLGEAWKQGLRGRLDLLALLLLTIVARAVSYGLLAALVVGLPMLAWRRWRRWTAAEATTLWLGGLFFVYTLSLCALHMVARFMPAVAGAGIVAALFLAHWGWEGMRRRG